MTARIARTVSDAADVLPPDAAAIVSALPDAVLLVDGEDVLRFVNPAAETFFGLGASALCGQRLADLVQFDNPLIALTAKARENLATLSEHDVDMLSARRAARSVDIQVGAMGEAEGWVLVSLRERSIAEKLDRQLTHRGAGRSVAGMAASLAHEIKNPLSGIRGAAQLLAREASAGNRELTGLITEEADRICRLIDRMEMFSDDRPTPRTPLNIHEILDHVRLIARNGFARHLRLSERYDPSLPEVLGDRDQLVQAFLNLVKNAAEAAPVRGGEVVLGTAFEPGVRLSVAGGGERVRLPLVVTVQDNGAGIPDDLRDCLFDPFVTGKPGGSGLGLSLVAKIIGDHGGMVEFASEPRRTVFRVLLPVADARGTAT